MSLPRALPSALVACALAAPAALAGCGGDDMVRVSRPALRVTLDEYRIDPQDVSVRPGRLKIIATNRGRLTHNVKVQIPPEEPGDRPEDLGGTETAQPGEKVTTKIRLKRGTYRLICTIGNHDDLGQYGRLVVER